MSRRWRRPNRSPPIICGSGRGWLLRIDRKRSVGTAALFHHEDTKTRRKEKSAAGSHPSSRIILGERNDCLRRFWFFVSSCLRGEETAQSPMTAYEWRLLLRQLPHRRLQIVRQPDLADQLDLGLVEIDALLGLFEEVFQKVAADIVLGVFQLGDGGDQIGARRGFRGQAV